MVCPGLENLGGGRSMDYVAEETGGTKRKASGKVLRRSETQDSPQELERDARLVEATVVFALNDPMHSSGYEKVTLLELLHTLLLLCIGI